MKDDLELYGRAVAAGWEWWQNVTDRWPGTPEYPATGWRMGSSFIHATLDPASSLRASKVAGFEHCLNFDHDYDCGECGRPIYLAWDHNVTRELIRRSECFSCHHWLDLIRYGKCVVAAHKDRRGCYTIMPPQDGFLGFGGQEFVIVWAAGRVETTRNLWSSGDVPERFWDRMPVNAALLEGSIFNVIHKYGAAVLKLAGLELLRWAEERQT